MKRCTIHIRDEVNIKIEGLSFYSEGNSLKTFLLLGAGLTFK